MQSFVLLAQPLERWSLRSPETRTAFPEITHKLRRSKFIDSAQYVADELAGERVAPELICVVTAFAEWHVPDGALVLWQPTSLCQRCAEF
jgi:hypothetical protein